MTRSIDLSKLPQELQFLSAYSRVRGRRYQRASWLVSNFEADVWEIRSCQRHVRVDWGIELGTSGKLLTDRKHASLLESFRSWLIIQTHSDWTSVLVQNSETEYRAIRNTLHLIDHLLLRADSLQLEKYGLAAITNNEMCSLAAILASNRRISTSIYEWPRRLSQFLRSRIETLTDSELLQATETAPFILAPPSPTNRITDLTDEEIFKARVWLWKAQAFVSNPQQSHGAQYSANTRRLARRIYSNTLSGGRVSHTVPAELSLVPDFGFDTEYLRARVTSPLDNRISSIQLCRYVRALNSLELLRLDGLVVPAFTQIDSASLIQKVDAKRAGRYRTLPQSVVFAALRKALEFLDEHGCALVDSYLNLVQAARGAGLSVGVFSHRNDIKPYLKARTIELGVKRWSVEWNAINSRGTDVPLLTRPEYYSELRSNVGLWQCLRVLYGAAQYVVGTLTARRQGELIDLTAGDCLDITRSWLLFYNRKPRVGDLRDHEARPIPDIAVQAIALMERLQQGLLDLGFSFKRAKLFSFPTNRGPRPLRKLNETGYNASLDYFCDWSESGLDCDGNRYYVRQHQLRRAFAMLFFWSGSFGGLNTLRWFLGHTDAAHLWRYITESVPGVVIRNAAAQWAAEGIKLGDPATKGLSSVLMEHFGTANFTVVDAGVLQDYIEDMLADGRVSVEPEFLDGGRAYRIAVIVRGG